MARLRIEISFDTGEIRAGLKRLKSEMRRVSDLGASRAAFELLRDSRPFVPLLTGALRDSGHVEFGQSNDGEYNLIWDVREPETGFQYAPFQYFENLQHVDGKYVSEWIDRAMRLNGEKYIALIALATRQLFSGGVE